MNAVMPYGNDGIVIGHDFGRLDVRHIQFGKNRRLTVQNIGAGDALSPSISVQNGDVQITKTVSLENIAVEYISVEVGIKVTVRP